MSRAAGARPSGGSGIASAWFVLPCLVAASFFAFLGAGPQDDAADWVFRNGTILTLEGGDAGGVEALAVRGSRIVYAGDAPGLAPWIGAGTCEVDLQGGALIPGLVDAHFHLLDFGTYLKTVNLIGTRSWQEVVDRVIDAAAKSRAGDWLVGRGWDQNDWTTNEFPTNAVFDSLLPGRLVFMRRVDRHAAIASGAVLERAGIEAATPNPKGGIIQRDSLGRATGLLIDSAMDAVAALIPEPSEADRESLIVSAARACAAAGLTGIHDARTSAAMLATLERMDREGRLPIRVYAFIDARDPAYLRLIEAGPRVAEGDGRLTVRGVKFTIDGALGSRGAALLDPYTDDSDNVGLLRFDNEEFDNLTSLAWDRGFQLAVHAIGDRANRVALDRYEALLASGGARDDRRPRIEHAQILATSDLPRFAQLGVIASMQPTHATSDMPWAESRVGPERISAAYAWRSLLDSGVHLAFGSDCPVESHRPLLGVFAAVTRQDLDGHPAGGWHPHERLTPLEALQGFTGGAAHASFEENRLGSLAVGKEADMVFVSADPLTVPAQEIPRLQVKATWVGGRLVFAEDGAIPRLEHGGGAAAPPANAARTDQGEG